MRSGLEASSTCALKALFQHLLVLSSISGAGWRSGGGHLHSCPPLLNMAEV